MNRFHQLHPSSTFNLKSSSCMMPPSLIPHFKAYTAPFSTSPLVNITNSPRNIINMRNNSITNSQTTPKFNTTNSTHTTSCSNLQTPKVLSNNVKILFPPPPPSSFVIKKVIKKDKVSRSRPWSSYSRRFITNENDGRLPSSNVINLLLRLGKAHLLSSSECHFSFRSSEAEQKIRYEKRHRTKPLPALGGKEILSMKFPPVERGDVSILSDRETIRQHEGLFKFK